MLRCVWAWVLLCVFEKIRDFLRSSCGARYLWVTCTWVIMVILGALVGATWMYITTTGYRGPGGQHPLAPKIFSKSCSFLAMLRETALAPWPKSWICPWIHNGFSVTKLGVTPSIKVTHHFGGMSGFVLIKNPFQVRDMRHRWRNFSAVENIKGVLNTPLQATKHDNHFSEQFAASLSKAVLSLPLIKNTHAKTCCFFPFIPQDH